MPLPDELVTTLEKLRQETSIGFSMVQTHRGVFYPTVVLQAQSRQVRVMTNLSDGRTPQWLSYVASEGCITLVADVVETQQLVVIDSPCGGLTSAMASELATRSARLDLAARLEDAAGLAQYLTRADALPSALDQSEVDEVHLVLVDAGMSTPSEQSAPFARDPASSIEGAIATFPAGPEKGPVLFSEVRPPSATAWRACAWHWSRGRARLEACTEGPAPGTRALIACPLQGQKGLSLCYNSGLS